MARLRSYRGSPPHRRCTIVNGMTSAAITSQTARRLQRDGKPSLIARQLDKSL
jgi:hypothetical protein